MLRSPHPVSSLLVVLALVGCSSDPPPKSGSAGQAGMAGGAGMAAGGAAGSSAGADAAGGGEGGEVTGGSGGAAGSAGTAGGGAGGGSGGGCVVAQKTADQPTLLSETGCVDMVDPTQPAPGLIPYSVRSPLWSDAAAKERFVRVAEGLKIHVVDCATEVDACASPGVGGDDTEDGHWVLPVGSVLVKNFSIEGKHIETRLLARRTATVWDGYSYEWNEDLSEANLIPDNAEFAMGKDKPVGSGTQVWHYPSRSQCLECHTKFAGRSLGPSTPQLNSDFAYAGGTMNQVEKFASLELFDAPAKDIPGYPEPFGTGTLDERARSYLRTNCAICHRPGGEFNTINLRFETPFADMKLCDVVQRDAGAVPMYRLVPGNPVLSTMSFRMHALDGLRMPKVGSSVLDVEGSKLIDDWITAMPASVCPDQQ